MKSQNSSFKFSVLRLGANAVSKIDSEATKTLNKLEDVNIASSNGSGGNHSKAYYIDSNTLDLISARISIISAKSAAIMLSSWAILPANRAVPRVTTSARRIA